MKPFEAEVSQADSLDGQVPHFRLKIFGRLSTSNSFAASFFQQSGGGLSCKSSWGGVMLLFWNCKIHQEHPKSITVTSLFLPACIGFPRDDQSQGHLQLLDKKQPRKPDPDPDMWSSGSGFRGCYCRFTLLFSMTFLLQDDTLLLFCGRCLA